MSLFEKSPYDVEHSCGHEDPPYYLTAYGMAVKLGFQGTVEEWLDSLKGNTPKAKVVALGRASDGTIGGGGYGTCIVMHNSRNCLVFDLGNDYGETLTNYLNRNGIKTIDAICISHFHSDHFQLKALQKLLASYTVKSVVLPHTHRAIGEGNDSYLDCYSEAESAAKTAGVTCCKPTEEGEAYTFGDFEVTCHNVCAAYAQAYYGWNYSELLYHLDKNGNEAPPNYNNFSMVNAVTYSGHKIVVTGDIMEPAVANTIDVLSTADLIFVPHHGLDIRFPPSAFNRLTAKHGVINAAYDSYGYLKCVSRAFAGELLKKGCRVTATFDGETVGYSIGDEITPVELGILAGNEIYPCSLLPGEDLDTLPDGEYITYSEKIAQSIVNAPPFTYLPLRKFKVKVETTCIQSKYEKGNRTQTAYTIDTSTQPEIASRNFTWGSDDEKSKYHAWNVTLATGQFHSVKRLVNEVDEATGETVTVDANVDQYLIEQIKDMRAPSYRKIVLSLGDALEMGAGGHWDTEIFKQSTNFAIITAKSPIQGGTSIQRIWFEGILNDWEWVNPPMYDGVVYRTTERRGGNPVYKKREDGLNYYRIGDGEIWTPVPDEGQFPYTLETDGDAHLDAILVGYIGAMSSPSFRKVYLKITDKLQSCGIGGHWDVEIFKQSANYALITARSPIRYGVTLQRAWFMNEDKGETAATLHPWEWVNPSMHEGEEYRTTERMKGEAVYKKLSGGMEYHRIGDSGDWVLKDVIDKQGAAECIDNIKDANGLVTEKFVPTFVAGLIEYKNGEFVYTNNTYANTLYCYTPEDTLYDVVKGTTMYFNGYDNGKMSVYYSTDGGATFATHTGRSWKATVDCKVKIKLLEVTHQSGVTVVNELPKYLVVKTPTVVERSRHNSFPIVTFIDDDCMDEALNNWEEISDETGVKPTIAVVTSRIGIDETKFPSWDKIKRLWCKGFEFISHTHGYDDGHKALTTLSAEEIESQLSLSVNAFHENGMNPRFLAYPGNATNSTVIPYVKKYFVGAVTGEDVINHANIKPFQLYRVSLNDKDADPVSVTYPDATTTTECSAYHTEAHMREVIDETVATNGWVIIMTHIRNQGGFYYDDNVKALIVNTIKYAAEQGCEILTLGEAYDKFRNRVTCEDFVVDCDGAKHIS